MNLLLIVLLVTFVSALRSNDRAIPARPIPLILICMTIAIAYLSQRVI